MFLDPMILSVIAGVAWLWMLCDGDSGSDGSDTQNIETPDETDPDDILKLMVQTETTAGWVRQVLMICLGTTVMIRIPVVKETISLQVAWAMTV